MTSERRFEQELPELLADLYMAPMPAYRDQVLQRTAQTRQRPAWTFIDRWLPWVATAREAVTESRIPWRSIGLVALLVAITLAVLAALIAGSRPRLPAPFGLARTGLVAYSSEGDIYTANSTTGTSTRVVTGPEIDLEPRWSLDGTRFAFERKVTGEAGPGVVYVAGARGTDPVQITPDPIAGITGYAFSPDGREVLIGTSPETSTIIVIAAADGSGLRELDVGIRPGQPAWRPPMGTEILFMSEDPPISDSVALYAVDVQSGLVRTIIEPSRGHYRDLATWSPDGSRIAYMEWDGAADGISSRIHVVAADGSGDHVIPLPPDAKWDVIRGWSNDGTRLLAVRGYTGGWKGSRIVAVPVDARGFGVEIGDPDIDAQCCSVWEWAPDDTSILGMPTNAQGQYLDPVLLDPIGGTITDAPWTTSSHPTWQRLAD